MTTNTIYGDGTYLDNNPSWHQEDSLWKAQKIIKMLEKNNITPSTLCEIGCGAGEILRCLSHNYPTANFSGYEISPQAYELSKKKEKSNLVFCHKDLLDEEVLQFDVAMAIDVFEHVEDYFGFLRKFRLRGKYKIFHIPLDLSVQSVARSSRLMTDRESVGHIHYFTKETALASLKDTGHEIVDYFYTNGATELPNRGWKAACLKLPRQILFRINPDMAARLLGGFSLLVLAK